MGVILFNTVLNTVTKIENDIITQRLMENWISFR